MSIIIPSKKTRKKISKVGEDVVVRNKKFA